MGKRIDVNRPTHLHLGKTRDHLQKRLDYLNNGLKEGRLKDSGQGAKDYYYGERRALAVALLCIEICQGYGIAFYLNRGDLDLDDIPETEE